MRALIGVVICIVTLLLLLKLIIAIPAVQTRLKYAIAGTIQNQLNSDVSIGHFSLEFPKKLEVNEIQISKNESDTLLYLSKFSVNIRILPLLRKQIKIQNINLTNGIGDFGKLMRQVPSDTTKFHLDNKEKRTSESWDLQINNLLIESCYFKYRDEKNSGFDIELDIGKAKLQIDSLNPATLISFNSVNIENTYLGYEKLNTSYSKNKSNTATSNFADIRLEETLLSNFEFSLIDSSGTHIFNVSGNDLEMSNLLVDLNNEAVIFEEGIMQQTSCAVSSFSSNDTTSSSYEDLNWGKSLWRVEGKELEIKDYNIIVENKEELGSSKTLNKESLNISDVSGRLANFILDQDILSVEIKKLSGRDINGFEIIELEAVLDQEDSQFSIRDLKLQTPISEYNINLTTNISPTNYQGLDGKSITLGLDIKSKNLYEIESFLNLMDRYDFLSKDLMNGSFELHSQISGELNNLNIEQFNFLYSDSTQIIARGRIKELMEPDSKGLEFQIDRLMVPKSLLEIARDKLITDSSFSAPDFLFVDGFYKSSNDEHHFSGNIVSNVGEITVKKAIVNFGSIPEYNLAASANLRNLNTVTDINLDNIAFTMNALYKGEDIYTAEGDIYFNLDSLTYNNYSYGRLEMTGELTNAHFGTKMNSLDSNLLFNLSAIGELAEDNLKVSVDADVEKIDLTSLNLYDEETTIGGKAAFDININNQNSFAVNSIIQEFDLCFIDTLYKLLPAELSFETNDFKTEFKLKGQFANFAFIADDYILGVVNSFVELPAYYLADAKNDSVKFNLPDFNIEGQINFPESSVSSFFSEWPEFTEFSVDGAYDKSNDKLNFDLSVPGVRHNNVLIDSLFLSISGSSAELDFRSQVSFFLEDIIGGDLNINGKIKESELVTNLLYFDTYSNQYLNITTQIQKDEEKILVHLFPEMLIMSYDSWEINPDNQFIFSPNSFELINVDLRNDDQQISFSSFPIENNQNIEVNIKAFDLDGMKQLYNLDTLVTGNLNADFKFLNIYNNPSIEGNLEVDSISFQDFDVGKLTLSGFMFKDNLVQAEMALTGKSGDIQVLGSYNNNKSNSMDLNLDINHLDLSELNYMLSDYIQNATGSINGRISVDGNIKKPVFNGTLNFTDAGTEILFFGTYFTLGNEIITIKNNIVDFGGLSIVNKQNQSAKIIGQISFDSDKMPYSNLQVITDNMKILNSTGNENDLVYGILKAQSDIKINGYADQLNVDANVEIDESSDFTYVFPENLAINDSKGVVRFGIYEGDSIHDKQISKTSTFFSLETFDDVKSQVKINKGSKVNIFFDREGNDFLEAAINGTVNHRLYKGNTEISGRLEVDEGQLQYSIPMVTANNYSIEPGSYLTLSNDIYNPYVNIVASTYVRASTEGLLDGHNRVLNFKVLLYLKGRLNNLKLRFDISSEINDAMVSSRLALLTEQERNINALNLLARGAFVIGFEGTEAALTSMVDAQIDRFLATQLNTIVSENIQFVDLHFDVQSFMDYGSADNQVFQRNYYYNVGKSFFQDRARINYMGSMELSSKMFVEQVNSSFVQNEFDVEVKIDKEGIFRGVFFRKNKYEGILEGEVVETGGGIRIGKNFDSVKDIFTRDKKSPKNTHNKDPGIENE